MSAISPGQLDVLVRSNPDIGLQTYEFLAGDSEARTAAKKVFLAGGGNPVIDYPLLDPNIIGKKADSLEDLLHAVHSTIGLSDEAREAYIGTVGYRLKEAALLLRACDMNQPHGDDEEFAEAVAAYQQTNEELYGVPNPSIVSGMAAELRHMTIGSNDYQGQARDVAEEVDELFFSAVLSSEAGSLPVLEPDAKAYLNDKIIDYFPHEHASVMAKVADLQAAGKSAFEPEDMVDIFLDVIARKGWEGRATAYSKPGSALVAWSQENAAVEVGAERDPISIDEPLSMFGITVHELGVHGENYYNGQSSEISVTGNGLYVVGEPGQSIDYLSFREGIASLYQNIAAQTTTPGVINNFRGTLNTSLAYQGKDFSAAHDVSWRLRALLTAQDGQITPESVTRANSLAYDDVLRSYRGAPMRRVAELGLLATYNKDLVYLPGKLNAVAFWNKYRGNDVMFDFVQSGNFDPTNSRQAAIMHAATNGKFLQ